MTPPSPADSPADWLAAAGAHHDLVAWARDHAASWASLWSTCPRGDWLLAIAARAGVDASRVTAGALAVAELARPYLPDDDERGPAVIAAVRAFLAGEGAREQCDAACDRAEARSEAVNDPAARAALSALMAAGRSARDPTVAAAAAAHAAEAAVFDAGDCAMMSALAYMQRTAADRVRDAIPFDVVAPHLG